MPTKRIAALSAVLGILLAAAAWYLRRPSLPVQKAGPPYVHPALCMPCHAEIAKSYARTAMARTFGRMRSDTPFPEGGYAHEASQQRFAMARREGRPVVRRDVAGEMVREAEAHYWIGSGNRAKGFVTRSAPDRLTLLPVTIYARDGWAMNPGYESPQHPGFDRVIDYRCISCHAGYPEVPEGADLQPNAWQLPEQLSEGIDCQRCHGPGRDHVANATRDNIVNPARLPKERQRDVCNQCHLETTSVLLPSEIIRFDRGVFSFRPGQPMEQWIALFDFPKGSPHEDRVEFVSSAYRLEKSACFLKSQRAMTCTTCHNPHSAAKASSESCGQCHQPHGAGKDCVGCHMPQRTAVDAVHIRATDHLIQKVPKREVRGTLPQVYRGPVAPYLGGSPLYEAVAQVTQQANLAEGARRLEELLTRDKPSQGEFYLQLGNAYLNLKQPDRARPWLEEAVLRMPRDWRPLVLLGTVAKDVTPLRLAVQLAPRETEPWLRLGDLNLERQNIHDAVAAYRQALAVRPDSAEVHHRLGRAYAMSGDGDAAEAALREAVRLRPELPQFHAELAMLLEAKGDAVGSRRHADLARRLGSR